MSNLTKVEAMRTRLEAAAEQEASEIGPAHCGLEILKCGKLFPGFLQELEQFLAKKSGPKKAAGSSRTKVAGRRKTPGK